MRVAALAIALFWSVATCAQVGRHLEPSPIPLTPGPVEFTVIYRTVEQRDLFPNLSRYCVITGASKLSCQVLFDNRSGQGIRAFGVAWELLDADHHVFEKITSLSDFAHPQTKRPDKALGKDETYRLDQGFGNPSRQPLQVHCHVRFIEFADGSVQPPQAVNEQDYKDLLASREKYAAPSTQDILK